MCPRLDESLGSYQALRRSLCGHLHFPDEETEGDLRGYPLDHHPFIPALHVGRVLVLTQSRAPPWLRWGRVRAYGGQGGPATARPPFPLLSPFGSAPTSRGPGLGAAIAPRSSFLGFGRVPAAPLQDPGPAPDPRQTNREAPVTVAPNPRGGRWRLPAGPTPAAAASFGPRSRPGGAAGRWLGSRRRGDSLQFPSGMRTGVSRAGRGGVYPKSYLPAHPGVKFPLTVSQ